MNKVEEAFYRDKDSIATMDVESFQKESTKINSSFASALKNKPNEGTRNQKDDQSVASSITIESLISKQSKLDTRID